MYMCNSHQRLNRYEKNNDKCFCFFGMCATASIVCHWESNKLKKNVIHLYSCAYAHVCSAYSTWRTCMSKSLYIIHFETVHSRAGVFYQGPESCEWDLTKYFQNKIQLQQTELKLNKINQIHPQIASFAQFLKNDCYPFDHFVPHVKMSRNRRFLLCIHSHKQFSYCLNNSLNGWVVRQI